MKLVRIVQLNDGRRITATIIMADLVTFERKFDVESPLLSQRLEHWLFLAWAALKRQGDISEEFDDFLLLVDDIENVEDEPVPKGARSKKVSLAS